MKKLITLLFVVSFFNSYTQDTAKKKNQFQERLKIISDNYRAANETNTNKWIVQPELQNERLTQAFNQVIFGNSDLVDNASAFGYTQNKEKTTVSISSNFLLKDNAEHQYYLKSGINSTGSGSIFNLYSRNEWKSSVGISIGLIFKFAGSSYSNVDKSKFKYHKIKREVFVTDSIATDITENFTLKKYIDLRKKYTDLLDAMKTDAIKYDSVQQEKLAKYYKDLKKQETFFKDIEINIPKTEELINTLQLDANDNRIKWLRFNQYSKLENKNNDKIIEFLMDKFWSNESTELGKIIKNVAAVFDKKNIKNTGYSFHWFDVNASFNNDSYSFSDASKNIDSNIKDDFAALDIEKKGINKLKTILSFNYNYTRNNLRSAFYMQWGLQYNSGSFLTSNLIHGTPTVSTKDDNNIYYITDDEGKDSEPIVLGDFNAITHNLQYGSFNFYSAYYFGKKKIFGLNLGLTHRYKIIKPEKTFYEKNYSILLGPIFRKPDKDGNTGLTFGIDVGFDNALYSGDAKDYFVARIRVGIPLKLYNINK